MEKSHFINMGVNELLHEMLVNDNVQFGEIDTYNHIRKNTNNFEIKYIQLLYVDILWFIEDICMTFENEIYPLELLSVLNIMHPNDILKYGIHNGEKLKETINYGDWKGLNKEGNKLLSFLNLAIELPRYNQGLKLEYNLRKVRGYVVVFNDVLKQVNIDIEKMMKDKDWKLKLESKKKIEPKQPITFSGLFKYPHNQNLEQFKKKLQECNLIDDKYLWREVDNNGKRTTRNDIGKFYNWLYLETIVFSKTTDKTNECICFCDNFGIKAYKEGEKPKSGRMVSVESITKAKYNSENSKYYDTHFKTWINKIK